MVVRKCYNICKVGLLWLCVCVFRVWGIVCAKKMRER